jgi:hypothetical protein
MIYSRHLPQHPPLIERRHIGGTGSRSATLLPTNQPISSIDGAAYGEDRKAPSESSNPLSARHTLRKFYLAHSKSFKTLRSFASSTLNSAAMNVRQGGREGGDISAIFIHAGAGYHSLQNERIHLEACSE